MTAEVLGIDLCTTNSAVGTITSGGNLMILRNVISKEIKFSIVYLHDADVIYIADARDFAEVNPKSRFTIVKRRIGADLPIRLSSQNYAPESISAVERSIATNIGLLKIRG